MAARYSVRAAVITDLVRVQWTHGGRSAVRVNPVQPTVLLLPVVLLAADLHLGLPEPAVPLAAG